MTFSVSGGGSKFGDQGEFAPAIHSEPIMITLNNTTAIDHGRRDGARSPLLLSIGAANRRMPITTGPRIIRCPSSSRGIIASRAKYQSKYQSGRGSARRMLGSGGLSS